MGTGLCGEFAIHIAMLGAVITSIRNRIPWWKQSAYSDEGTLDIKSSQPSMQQETRWGEIGWIVMEFSIYLAMWARIYGLV